MAVMLHLITYENTTHSHLAFLKRTAEIYDWPKITVLGAGERWRGFGTKIFAYTAYLNSLPAHDIAVVVDARDVLVNGTVAQFMEGFERVPNDTLFVSAEFGCCARGSPHISAETRAWVESLSPDNLNRYLNSGMVAGRVGTFQRVYPFGMTRYDEDDQNSMVNFWHEHPRDIALDYDEVLFSNSNWSPNERGYALGCGRWMSKHTGSSPVFVQTQAKAWKTYDKLLSLHGLKRDGCGVLVLCVAIVALVIIWCVARRRSAAQTS